MVLAAASRMAALSPATGDGLSCLRAHSIPFPVVIRVILLKSADAHS